jgi:hypothetical protein
MNCPVWICEPVTTTTLPTTTSTTSTTSQMTTMTSTTSQMTTSIFNTSTVVPVTTSETPNSDFEFDFSVAMNIVFLILLLIFLIGLGVFFLRKRIQQNENTQITDAESVQTVESSHSAPSASNPNQHFGLDSDSDDLDDVPLHTTNDNSTNSQPESFFMKCLKRPT